MNDKNKYANPSLTDLVKSWNRFIERFRDLASKRLIPLHRKRSCDSLNKRLIPLHRKRSCDSLNKRLIPLHRKRSCDLINKNAIHRRLIKHFRGQQEKLGHAVNREINCPDTILTQTIGQQILAQLKETGYLGCFSDTPDLSENYKDYLDFSDKT